MRNRNSYYFNAHIFLCELVILAACIFMLACGRQDNTKQISPTKNQILISASAININTASAAELEKLPSIGAKTAVEIIEHREKFGKFSQPEHLMFVRGISDKRFRELRSLIKVE